MDRISIPAAIVKVHEKDKEVRTACLPFDLAMLRIRREYMLSMDHSQWTANIAARLELTNKDHRAGLRMSLRDGVDLMAEMNAKHAGALDLCQRLEELMEKVQYYLSQSLPCAGPDERDTQVNAVNHMYGKDPATPVKDRVRLRRSMPQFVKQFKEATENRETILQVAAEWMPYFVTLTSKNALDQLIEIDHSMKISKKVFLSEAKPHCKHLARLYRARDELISASGRLAFRLETTWLSSPGSYLPSYRVNHELQKFEEFLTRAQAHAVEHGEVERALEELSRYAASPTVVTGLDGGEVDFARLREAYVEFRQFMSLLDTTIKVCAGRIASNHTLNTRCSYVRLFRRKCWPQSPLSLRVSPNNKRYRRKGVD
ncbi:hypothetical protein C8T65DRAFT_590465 [Cerioporus squamosus]|nr:hypothetical protein C8T65DRAFT_590465 [Cerioporus squamosus]